MNGIAEVGMDILTWKPLAISLLSIIGTLIVLFLQNIRGTMQSLKTETKIGIGRLDLKMEGAWKEAAEHRDKMKGEIKRTFEKYCEENQRAHSELWGRINFHGHTERGDVILRRGE